MNSSSNPISKSLFVSNFNSPNYSQTASFFISIPSFSLPSDPNWMPILSNGHIGVQVMSHNVYMNGVYNGERGLSHRARIPNYSNVIIDPGQFDRLSTKIFHRMNYRHAIFETVIELHNQFTIRHMIYAHRYYSRAIVNEIFVTRTGNYSSISKSALNENSNFNSNFPPFQLQSVSNCCIIPVLRSVKTSNSRHSI